MNLAVVGKPSLTAEFLKQLPVVKWDPYQIGAPQPQGGADAGASGDATGSGQVAPSGAKSSGCQANPVASRGLGLTLLLSLLGWSLARVRRRA